MTKYAIKNGKMIKERNHDGTGPDGKGPTGKRGKYCKDKFGKKYEDLTKKEKNEVDKYFNEAEKKDGKKKVSKIMSNLNYIKKWDKDLKDDVKELKDNELSFFADSLSDTVKFLKKFD